MQSKDSAQEQFILALDQGTTSCRAIVFSYDGEIVGLAQKEHKQIFPRAGWVEHNPIEIWENTVWCIREVLFDTGIGKHQLAAVGITNQRETTVVWEKATGKPVYNAIVWQDTRTDEICETLAAADSQGESRFSEICGLPLATYFSGPKIRWVLDNVEGARERAEAGELLFGTTDSWLIWNLTGGVEGGLHATDVTNASRTMLMDLRSLSWSEPVCETIGVPLSMLPEIKPSVGVYRECAIEELAGVVISGVLGDQQAALFGHACFDPGMMKNTYGTGCFALMNVGTEPVFSEHGLLTTVAYQLEGDEPRYALEGSVAVAGSLVQWLRDNLGLIQNAAEVEALALSVENNGGVYFVPAFSGLFAPYWKADARGVITGLTRFNNRGHIARAALEATAFQTREVIEAMTADAHSGIAQVRVDGGMVANQTLMQFQADILGLKVVAPKVRETTALGAAYAAGMAVGYYRGFDEIAAQWQVDEEWQPKMVESEKERKFRLWKKAVTRSFGWVDQDVRQ